MLITQVGDVMTRRLGRPGFKTARMSELGDSFETHALLVLSLWVTEYRQNKDQLSSG